MASVSANLVTDSSTDYDQYESLSFLLAHVNRHNPKDHDLGLIIASIERHGFVGFVTIDQTSCTLVAGHGRLKALLAMKREGMAPPSRIKVAENGDWMVPVHYKAFASEIERDAYTIADNATTIKGGWDNGALAEMLTLIAESELDDPFKGVGFDGDDLDLLLMDAAWTPPLPPERATRYGIIVALKDPVAEDRLGALLDEHDYQYVRMSANGRDTE